MDILAACNSVYYTKSLAFLETSKSKSVDLIVLQAVPEHVQHHEFLRQCVSVSEL